MTDLWDHFFGRFSEETQMKIFYTIGLSSLIFHYAFIVIVMGIKISMPTNLFITLSILWGLDFIPLFWCMNEVIKVGLTALFGD